MKYEMFSRVALAVDIPEDDLKKGDIATVIEYFEPIPDREAGYILEIFNVLGDTIAVTTVFETQLMPLTEDEVPAIRHRFAEAA
jgi:hypothetical protein